MLHQANQQKRTFIFVDQSGDVNSLIEYLLDTAHMLIENTPGYYVCADFEPDPIEPDDGECSEQPITLN